MAIDLESLGGGAGAGLLGTLFGLFGINRRLDRVEESKQDINVCDERWKAVLSMKEDISYIRSRIDIISNGR